MSEDISNLREEVAEMRDDLGKQAESIRASKGSGDAQRHESNSSHYPWFLRSKIIWLIVILAVIIFNYERFFSGPFSQIHSMIEGFFSSYFSVFFVDSAIRIFYLWLAGLGLIFLFIKNETRKEKWFITYSFLVFLVATLVFGITWYNYNPEEFQTQLEGTQEEGQRGITGFVQDFKCTFLKGITIEGEECEKLETEATNEVQEEQKVTITPLSSGLTQLTLDSPEEGILFRYEVDAPIPITLEKFECFSSKNSKSPFFESDSFEEETILFSDTIIVECENLGTIMKEKEEKGVSVFAYLHFSVENDFTHQFPVINCEHSSIEDLEERTGRDCESLTWDKYRELVDSTAKSYSNTIKGGNAVDVTLNFFGLLPLKIGDGESQEIDIELVIKEKTGIDKLGEYISGALLSINPSIYLSFADSAILPSQTAPISFEVKDGKVVIPLALLEEDGEEFRGSKAHTFVPFSFTTRTTHKVKSSNPKLDLTANFEIEKVSQEIQIILSELESNEGKSLEDIAKVYETVANLAAKENNFEIESLAREIAVDYRTDFTAKEASFFEDEDSVEMNASELEEMTAKLDKIIKKQERLATLSDEEESQS